MSVTLWLALVLQFCSVALLRIFLGKTWLRRPGTLLVLASVVYDGLSQVLLSFPSIAQWDIYRNGIQPGFIAEADLVMSAGMLAFTVAYLMTCGPRREAPAEPDDAVLAAKVLDWRILALACLPLAVLTYEGRGFNAAVTVGPTGALASGFTPSAGADLASSFFVLLAVLASFSFLARHGTRWFVPVLLTQSALIAAAGERAPVIWGAVVLGVLAAWPGMRLPRRQVAAAAVLTLAAVLAIGAVRASQGRGLFTSDTGLQARVEALGTDAASAGRAPDSPGLVAQAAARLDGTTFAAAVLQAQAAGQPRLSAAGVPQSLLIAVPSALWPSKLAHGLDPYDAQIGAFALQRVNFLPGLPGLYAGFLPAAWLAVFLAVLGAVWGGGERWLLRRRTPARMVALAGALMAAMMFEAGLPAMVVTMRSAAVAAVLAWLAARMRAGSHQAKWTMIKAKPGPPAPPAPDVPVPLAM